MDKNLSVWLVSVAGITNTLGRVLCGWVSSYESVDAVLVNNLSLTFGGVYTLILPLLPYSVFSYYLYASLFGLSMGMCDFYLFSPREPIVSCTHAFPNLFNDDFFFLLFIYLACFASLRSTMIVELTGLELLTNAFGVLLMFQGVAAAVGSPVLGKYNLSKKTTKKTI